MTPHAGSIACMTSPNPRRPSPGQYYCVSGKVNSADKLYLVIESVKPDTKHGPDPQFLLLWTARENRPCRRPPAPLARRHDSHQMRPIRAKRLSTIRA
jgi:hypothetical protein